MGSLGHACCVIRSGKTFLRRLFELLSVARKAHHHLRLNASVRSDLGWWHTFLAPLNQASFFRAFPSRQSRFTFYTDASGSIGCGAIWSPQWFQVTWSGEVMARWPTLGSDSITFKELLPIVWALAVWGVEWKNASVTVYCDNSGAVAGVNSGYSKIPRIMHLLRRLFFIRARFNIELIALHVPGVVNCLADAISRDQLSFLFTQVPAAIQSQCQLPSAVVSLLLDQHLDWLSPSWRESFGDCFPLA